MQFLETVKYEFGEFQNITFHQARIEKTKTSSKINLCLELQAYLRNIKINISKSYRFRIIYDEKIKRIEHFEIKKREFKKLKLIFDNEINYSFKYSDRSIFDKYLKEIHNSNFDEILIIKNNLVTDTSISNVAFYDQNLKIWKTPATFLLNGTTRQRLLKNGKIIEENLTLDEIKKSKYTKVAMLNAILGFYILKTEKNLIFI
jgi:4-amino-4-deoxychorismate lyase